MPDLIWTSAAFRVLELLPQAVAYGIVRQTDHLSKFPELGSHFFRPKHLSKYRQMIYQKTFRIIYRFDKAENCVHIVQLQNCRQKFPSAREIKRAYEDKGELPLD